MQPAALRVLLEPAAQPRPLAQQRLVRDLDLALADRDQAVVGEHGEDVGDALAVELVERDAAAHDRVALAFARQPQQDPARHARAARGRAARRRARRAARPRRARRRCARRRPCAGAGRRGAARARAARWTAAAARRARPRRPPSSASTSSGSTSQAGAPRGQLDRAAQLVAAHRPDEHVVGAQQPRKLRVGRAAPVEVGADGDEHERAAARIARACGERVGERGALVLVAAGREDLLELVDGDDQPAVGRGARRSPARAPRSGCSPGRSSASGQRSLPGSTPAASAASSPARSAEDLPLPDGPDDARSTARRSAARPARRRAARGRRRTRRRRRRTTPGP